MRRKVPYQQDPELVGKGQKRNVGATSSVILSAEGSLTTIDEQESLLNLNFSNLNYFDGIQSLLSNIYEEYTDNALWYSSHQRPR